MRRLFLEVADRLIGRVIVVGVRVVCRIAPLIGRERAGNIAVAWMELWERLLSVKTVRVNAR